MARENHALNHREAARAIPAEESVEEAAKRLKDKKVKSPAETRKESAQKAALKMHKAEALFVSAKAQFEALKRTLDVKQKYGVDITKSEKDKVEAARSAMLKAQNDFVVAQGLHSPYLTEAQRTERVKKAKMTDIVSRAQKELAEPEPEESRPVKHYAQKRKTSEDADMVSGEIGVTDYATIAEKDMQETDASKMMVEPEAVEIEEPEAESKRWAEAKHFKGRDLDAQTKSEKAAEAGLQETLDTEGYAESAKILEAGAVVKHRLEEIAQELKTLGYDLEAQIVKPPFWGSLTKKGRLILEFIKLSDDKNYQALLQAQEDIRRKPGAANDNREIARAMSYRAGGVVSKREYAPGEDKGDRARLDLNEAREKKQMESGTAGPELKMKAGKKAEKMLEQINEELAVFGLTGPDLLTIDRKTAKIVTNAGTDIKKLRKEYAELIEDPNYKYYLNHKK